MSRLFLYVMILFSAFAIGCNSNESNDINDISSESIWFDYRITGEEGNDSVTVLLQYRLDGEFGETIVLAEPAKAELDGQIIKAGHSKMTGEYYELRQAVSAFTGKHTISFTDINKKQYKEEFTFQPFLLAGDMPDTISRAAMIFQLQGLAPGGYVRILMTDTAFASEGIDRIDKIRDGQIIITESELSGLANGPIHLELIREDEKPVKNGTDEGGRIAISYGIKREFILKD
ncbi:MAG: hypothetical protein HOP10_09850 [Chitinophagaceae bacterium]|nr:hypothetical protein [Chitinophagaceae bacterium]